MRTLRIRLTFLFVCSSLSGLATGAGSLPAPEVMAKLWHDGVQSYTRGDFEGAKKTFSEWTEMAAASGEQSAQANYNLGLTELELKAPGPAIYYILKSATLRLSPNRIWHDIISLSDLQKKIGVKENVADDWFFRFSLLVNASLRLLLCALAFWSLCATLFIVWINPTPASRWIAIQRTLLVTSGGLMILVGVAYFNHRYYCHFAVLTGPGETVSVFRTQERKKEDILADFPAGTIVNVLKEGDTEKNIDAPIAGWVSNESLKTIE